MKRALWLPLLLLFVVAGCGQGKVKRVHGVATLDDQPLVGASITFWHSDEPAYPTITGPDGSFEVFQDPRPEMGLKPTTYTVLVTKFGQSKVDVREGVAIPVEDEGFLPGTRNTLPRIYNDKDRCPFKIELKPGDNEVKLELKTPPKS